MLDKRERIYQEIKQEITGSAPATRLPSIRKLMARFETSQRTIESVAERLISEQLLDRRPGEGYFVRNVSRDRKYCFRLFYPKWPSEFFMTFEQTLFRLSEENGTFEISSYALESTEAFATNLPQSGYDALILALPSGPIGLDFVRQAAALPMPIVLFDNEVGNIGFSSVGHDFYAGGSRAAAHLIANGHRKLAVLVTEPHNAGVDMRIEGFREFARLSGAEATVIETGVKSWQPQWRRVVYDALAGYIEEHGLDFTGLFLASSPSALEVYKVFFDRGIAIPEDVSIIGHDLLSTNDFMHPPLTAVGGNIVAMAETIVKKLLAMMAGESENFQVRLKAELEERGSVRNLNATRPARSREVFAKVSKTENTKSVVASCRRGGDEKKYTIGV